MAAPQARLDITEESRTMTDGPTPPLRPILEPGEYRVLWQVPDKNGTIVPIDGDLVLAADRPPRAMAYGDLPGTWAVANGAKSAAFPQQHDGGEVHGQLLNGMHVVLIDTVVEASMADRTRLIGRAALVGRSAAPQHVLVRRIEVQVEALDAFVAIPPLKPEPAEPPDATKRYLESEWTAVGEPESTQEWSDDGAEVAFRYYVSRSFGDWWAFRVTFSPVVLITPNEPISFTAAFDDWVTPLRNIISVSTGRAQPVTHVAVDLADDDDRSVTFQVFGSALHQRPYASFGNTVRKRHPSFRVAPTQLSLLKLLRRWQEMEAEHHPLVETYGSLIYAKDQHPRARLLLLLQAIEGLYGHEHQAAYEARVVKHTARRVEVLEALAEVSADVLKFVKKYLAKTPPSTLDEAIMKTLQTAPVDVTGQLAATKLLQDAENVPAGLRVMRNKMAHGVLSYDVMDLYEIVQPLEGVVRANMVRVLGGSDDDQRRAQEQ